MQEVSGSIPLTSTIETFLSWSVVDFQALIAAFPGFDPIV
jgi:hypothetical protein